MKIIKLMLALFFINSANAQSKLFSKSAKISFFSKTPMENISAVNGRAISILDPATGRIEFSVLIKGFEFEKALMQEHFNENYMESDLYPKASFTGTVENFKDILLSEDKTYQIKVNGNLTVHGITKQVSIPAAITVKSGVVSTSASFSVAAADYKIKIPSIVSDKISRQIQVTVTVPVYQTLK